MSGFFITASSQNLFIIAPAHSNATTSLIILMNNTTTPDPITTQERVMVRQTATGFEQAIAGVTGFFTAGPIGALAAWGAIRGLQGKWTPWFLLGLPASFAINLFYIIMLVIVGGVSTEMEQDTKKDAMIVPSTQIEQQL